METACGNRPDLDWVQVGRLGPDPLVARALIERAAAAAAAENVAAKSPRQTVPNPSQ